MKIDDPTERERILLLEIMILNTEIERTQLNAKLQPQPRRTDEEKRQILRRLKHVDYTLKEQRGESLRLRNEYFKKQENG